MGLRVWREYQIDLEPDKLRRDLGKAPDCGLNFFLGRSIYFLGGKTESGCLCVSGLITP